MIGLLKLIGMFIIFALYETILVKLLFASFGIIVFFGSASFLGIFFSILFLLIFGIFSMIPLYLMIS